MQNAHRISSRINSLSKPMRSKVMKGITGKMKKSGQESQSHKVTSDDSDSTEEWLSDDVEEVTC